MKRNNQARLNTNRHCVDGKCTKQKFNIAENKLVYLKIQNKFVKFTQTKHWFEQTIQLISIMTTSLLKVRLRYLRSMRPESAAGRIFFRNSCKQPNGRLG